MENKKEQNFIDYSIKALAILGLVFILFLGGVGVVKLVGSTSGFFSNLSSAFVGITSRFIPAERIDITVDPVELNSGEVFTLSFIHETRSEPGSYKLFYDCVDGVHFERDNEVIFCNTEYNLLNENTTLDLRAFSLEDEFVSAPLEIRFYRNDSERIDAIGEAEVDIFSDLSGLGDNNDVISRARGERTERTELFNETNSGGSRPSDPLGTPDLFPRILEAGVVDRATNEFTATSSIPSTARAAVKFEVENIGTKTSSGWRFNSVLPSFPQHIFYSDSQVPLAPGDRIEFILGFDSIRNDGTEVVFVVNIDPSNSVRELDENNNIVKTTLDVFSNE